MKKKLDVESIYEIAKWHEETFPDATLEGQIEKYAEEQEEWVNSKYKDVTELADMFIVACGMVRFNSPFTAIWYLDDVFDWQNECSNRVSEEELMQAVAQKMQKNRKRELEKKDGLYKHKGGKDA